MRAMNQKIAIIIGAGPAGLTGAYELVTRTDIKPIVLEATNDIGGISKTVNYKGNRIDIGGHRFFSKSDRVLKWWQNIMPLAGKPAKDDLVLNREVPIIPNGPDPEKTDRLMIIRNRLSRIFFLRKFFNYPIALNFETIMNLGFLRTFLIAISYFKTRLFPIKPEKSLEDFFVNRFGKKLYLIFFKDYTEKVWGIPCDKIKPDWGAQRVKGLSITKVLLHALNQILKGKADIKQKKTETSLIETFFYPKYGPGQLWEEVASVIKEKGGDIVKQERVIKVQHEENKIVDVETINETNANRRKYIGDYFFSSIPVKDLIEAMGDNVTDIVLSVARELKYRDFMTVGLLLKKLKLKNKSKMKTINDIVPDNWIYIQENDVRLGRVQVFNNWSPYMVKDENTVWLGLEYFCNEGDKLWSKPDDEFAKFAIDELAKINIIEKEHVIDSVVIRMPKTYPAYFGSYENFHVIRAFTDAFKNLFLIGRNGMHRYNNQDHSMLSAMVAVDNIISGREDKQNIWAVNAEEDYHEEK